MKLHKAISILVVAVAAVFSVSCVELVVSVGPWFDVEDGAVAEPRLRGSWCLDDEGGECSRDERLKFVPGPGQSWNVLGDGKVRYRVWVGDIEGTRYLDWMFLCEPSRDADEDDCLDLELPLGTHLLTQVTLLEEDRIEFRILDGETVANVLTHRSEPIFHARLDDGRVVVENSDVLAALLSEHGEQPDLWEEETFVMARQGRPR